MFWFRCDLIYQVEKQNKIMWKLIRKRIFTWFMFHCGYKLLFRKYRFSAPAARSLRSCSEQVEMWIITVWLEPLWDWSQTSGIVKWAGGLEEESKSYRSPRPVGNSVKGSGPRCVDAKLWAQTHCCRRSVQTRRARGAWRNPRRCPGGTPWTWGGRRWGPFL